MAKAIKKTMTEQEKKEKHFIGELKMKLDFFEYKDYSISKVKEDMKEIYYFKKEEEVYEVYLDDLATVIFFDDFRMIDNRFLYFFKDGKTVTIIRQLNKVVKEKKVVVKTKYIKADYDKKNLDEYKNKIRQLLKVDKKIKITEIANELGITRQAIYKNKELKSFIDSLKK